MFGSGIKKGEFYCVKLDPEWIVFEVRIRSVFIVQIQIRFFFRSSDPDPFFSRISDQGKTHPDP